MEETMDLGLKGKVALVTGGSKGLGFAIAEEFAKEGADLSICARSKPELEKAAKALREYGAGVHAVSADVSKASDTSVVISGGMEKLGRIDILINNAGDGWLSHMLDTTDEEWRYCLEVNLMSAVRFTREVAPHMRKQGHGRIINISTLGAKTPIAMMNDYSTAKAAMLAFSKSASFELAPHNILVNCVCPAFISSPLWDKLADSAVPAYGKNREEVFQNLANQFIALKRFGQAKEVAGLVAFLASDRASFITGSIYDIDGGVTKSI
jgi:NAD(P)-dependent dehydrogenase (short-subunit alcohol dehydrogenase family)